MEWLENILKGDAWQWVVVVVLTLNAALSGFAAALEKVGKAEKMPAVLKKIAEIIRKVVDWISGNVQHK
jgi:hypothetical protein